jgi:RNA polymerase sigma-70 factor (ECF subfamily)
LDAEKTECRYRVEVVDEMSPERAFERQWAITLLEQAQSRLEAELAAAGKTKLYDEFKGLLSGEKSQSSYAEVLS